MGEITECFVCGTLLAMSEKRFVNATTARGKMAPREVCRTCYYKAVAHGSVMASHDGESYTCQPRTLQRDLFGRTYRKLVENGGRDV